MTFSVQGIFVRKYFYPLCSDFECFADLPAPSKAGLVEAKKASSEILCLPFFGDLSEADIDQISPSSSMRRRNRQCVSQASLAINLRLAQK